MERRHVIIIVMFLLTIGMLLHGFKTLRRARFGAAEHAGLNIGDVDDTPYHVSADEMDSDRQRAQGRGHGMHLAGAVSKFNHYDFSGGKVVAKAKEEVKKKKKKTDKPEAKPIVATEIPMYNIANQQNTNTDNGNTNNVVGTVGEAPKPAAPAGGVAGGAANTANSYEAWAAKILGAPNPGEVNALVAAFKGHQVTPQVFYQILDAMILTNNAQQQSLAVTAASDVPSAQSFEFLVQVSSQNIAAAQQATTAISGYSATTEVDALKYAMSAYITNATVIQDATTVLYNSAETYIGNRTTAGTTTSLSTIYSGFIPILNRVIATYTNNATIEQNASAALQLIDQVVTQ